MRMLLVILMTFSSYSFAEGYQDQIDTFFTLYKADKVDEAIDGIYESNKYVSSASDQIKQLKAQLSSLEELVGKLHFETKIGSFDVGGLFVQETYLVTFDRQPIRFEFQFFKVNDGWRIYSFSFDDDIDEDIEAIAREQAILKE